MYVLASPILISYDLSGQKLWSLSLHGQGNYPFSISADSSGVYVSGILGPSLWPLGYLNKYDFRGIMVWNVTFDSPDQGGVGHTLVSADSSGVYVSMLSGRGSDYVRKYDSFGHQLWSFQTPLNPNTLPFLVAPVSGGFYIAGATSLSYQGEPALVQAFSASPSLIFFGSNPPLSFVLLGASMAVIVLSVLFLSRRYTKIMSKRPKSASPDRFRNPGGR